jgi:hypothetical protein
MGLQANSHVKLVVEKAPPRKAISDTIPLETNNQLIIDVMAAVKNNDPILIVDGKIKNLSKTSKYLLDMLSDD